jgi:photosystem II stability/assembly factor-like uncharacterized protein
MVNEESVPPMKVLESSMKVHWSMVRCCVAAFAMVGVSQGAPLAQSSSFDPLVRASTPSPRAASALMTAVAPAGTRLVAVGERGTILMSDDNGASWKQRSSPVSVMLTNVRFANAQVGWAVGHGGVVLATIDGGATWSKQLDGVRAAEVILRGAKDQASSDDHDAGKKAVADAERLVVDGPDKPLLDLLVNDEHSVLVVGAYGFALRTQDGGATWEDWHSHIPNTKGSHLYAICRIEATIYIAGEQGSVFRSTDNGQNFTALQAPYSGSFFGAACTATKRVIVFGLRGNAYASDDGGATWTRSMVGTSASLTGGTGLKDGSVVLVSQAGNVLRSVDGGLHFDSVGIKAPVPFVAVAQAADGSLVMAGVRGMTRAAINYSSDKP